MVLKAPIVPVLKYLFRSWPRRRKILFYQSLVLLLTYLSYMSYHAAKRPFSVMKGVFSPDCNATSPTNISCHPWQPFVNKQKSKDLFGLLDCSFLITYALAMFVSGYIAEHTDLRVYLSVGMVTTGLLTAALGFAYFFNVHSLAFFFVLLTLTGITQATGWPCVVEAVGMWFPKGRRGMIMGIWNTHTSVGNIAGSALAGLFATNIWAFSFFMPGLLIGVIGILNYILLIPDPSHIGIVLEKPVTKKLHGVGGANHAKSQQAVLYCSTDSGKSDVSGLGDTIESKTPEAIGLLNALRIPGVVEYSLCLFFAKLVSYTFLFWLPFYISATPIQGQHLDASHAANLATLFDVGGAVGGVVAGLLVDQTDCPGIVNVTMLLIAAPCLFWFKWYGSKSYTSFITYMMLSGCFVNGPYGLITTAVSASLGSHKSLQGNSKAMAIVTSIIDATGSLGAAVGPLLAGVVSSARGSWDDVFYMLIGSVMVAALLLCRQYVTELKRTCASMCKRARSYSLSLSTDETKNLVRV